MTYRIALNSHAARQRAHTMVDKAPDGYMVTIAEPTRSDAQNKALWARLSDVALSMPQGRKHTPDVWKALFMQACGHEQAFEMGLDNRPFPLGFRSSKLTVAQMADLLAFIDAWGTANGVQWKEAHRDIV
jgi:hypothetical protein